MTTPDRHAHFQARIDEWARYARESGDEPAIPAATVVVLRDTDVGVETLMLRKNSKIAFGGLWVFPGGRVDDEDWDAPDDHVGAARNAAVREAMEETSLTVDGDRMVLFSHWIPPSIAPKRFATWFFAGRSEHHDVRIDDGEIVEMEWMTPGDALRRRNEGEIELVPPTIVTLHTFLGFDTVEAALTHLADRPPRHHVTRIQRTEGGLVAMWGEDAAHESGDLEAPGPRHRLEVFAGGYRYDDSGVA